MKKSTIPQFERFAIILLVCSKCVPRKQLSAWVFEYFTLKNRNTKQKNFKLFWQRKLKGALKSTVQQELKRKIDEVIKDTHIISILDEEYPKSLLELDVVPLVLFLKSQVSLKECFRLLTAQSLAVVGTRRITGYGTLVTKKILREFEQILQEKIPIISGFMYGVDQLAHQVAVDLSVPTVAVLAHGVATILPRDISLYEKILQSGGVIISEYAPWEKAAKWTFIERNRIVAALCSVILVPEAAIKSGSFHTVEFGLDLGKTICAVPGPITSPYSDGTRSLLNAGATLVGSGEELLAVFLPELQQTQSQEVSSEGVQNIRGESATGATKDRQKSLEDQILSLLKTQSLSAEQIGEQTKLPLKKVLYELSNLELQSKVGKKGSIWMLQYHLLSG